VGRSSGKAWVDMGITKNQLKSIVKECLVEILSEGMGPSVNSSINEASRKVLRQPTNQLSTSQKLNQQKTKLQTSALKEAIRREAGGNDMMAAILADTATNTLPSMLENDRTKVTPSVGGSIERVVASHDPEELFGEEAASKWADLAFTGLSKK